MSDKNDWKCPECGYNNFSYRDECQKCKCWKSKAFLYKSNSTGTTRKGDWNCSCGELNFASRTNCRKCRKNKSGDQTQNNSNMKSGDWNCSCGELNFASRVICRKCHKDKCDDQSQNMMKPGDWICSSCDLVNFGSRSVCYDCGTPKVITQEETCVICMERNIDTVITVCKHLGYCNLCALSMNKCPICRTKYDPDTQLLKVFKVK